MVEDVINGGWILSRHGVSLCQYKHRALGDDGAPVGTENRDKVRGRASVWRGGRTPR
jgi:hypothetical protein